MKLTIIPIVIGAFGTITKGLLKGLEDLYVDGRAETIQMTVLLRTARCWKESWRLEDTRSHSNSSEKPSAKTDVKKGYITTTTTIIIIISTWTLVGNYKNNRDWCFRYSHQRIIKTTGGLGGWRTSIDHPNHSIILNGQDTGKYPGDLRRFVVKQTSVKDHQLKLIWKTFIE